MLQTTNVKQFKEKTNGLMYIQNKERKPNMIYRTTTTTELQNPDLEKTIKNVAGFN